MKKMSRIESFESFEISKQTMNQITGSRTREFKEGDGGLCYKEIDNNDGEVTKMKIKDRYQGKC